MDDPFPRTLGNRAMHSLSLQRHLHEQMQSNSELCDVTLVVNQVVSHMDLQTFENYVSKFTIYFCKLFFFHRKSELTGACL